MHLDPDVVLSKRLSTFLRWQLFARADAMVDEYREAEAAADLERRMGG